MRKPKKADVAPNSTSRIQDRFWLFALICGASFLAITLARVQYGHGKWWDEPLRDLALGFFPLGLSIILMEYWMRNERRQETLEHVEHFLNSYLGERLSKLSSIEGFGVLSVRESISNVELAGFLKSARRQILILVPFFVEPTVLGPIFREKSSIDNFVIKVVLLHPDSPFLRRRAEVVLGGDKKAGAREAQKTLLMLRNALTPSKMSRAEIRTYDSLPSAFIAVCDDRALLGMHLNTGTALQNPHFEILVMKDGEPTLLGRMIEEELAKVSADTFSRRVDLEGIGDQGELRN